MKIISLPILMGLSVFIFMTYAKTHNSKSPRNFLFIGGDGDRLEMYREKIISKEVQGVQVLYTWKTLETHKDIYNFSQIEDNLKLLNGLHKKLFIQIQDRFFSKEARNVPNYLLNDKEYLGGLVAQYDHPGENKALTEGWVAKQWNAHVRERYQKLLQALAKEFDGKLYGINLPETAIDIDMKAKENKDFSCDAYFEATLDNLKSAKKFFKKSYVVQYVNFFPCEWGNDHHYMSRLFAFAVKNNIGLGGPDVIPYRKAQMHNTYPFFHQYKSKLNFVAMAVQLPDYTYVNPQTKKHFSKQDFIDFASNYLGATAIFWEVENK